MTTPVFISAAVEGITDEALLKRLCEYVGTRASAVYGKNGKQFLLSRLHGYNNSARFRHWVVLLDLDNDADCAPTILPNLLSAPAALMCLRLAVREMESWLMSDGERIAQFLSINPTLIPPDPEATVDPKATLVNLARKSRKSDIREDMVPRIGSGQPVGPAYASRIIEFLQDRGERGWRPEVAEAKSASLRRCIAAMRRLVALPFPAAHS